MEFLTSRSSGARNLHPLSFNMPPAMTCTCTLREVILMLGMALTSLSLITTMRHAGGLTSPSRTSQVSVSSDITHPEDSSTMKAANCTQAVAASFFYVVNSTTLSYGPFNHRTGTSNTSVACSGILKEATLLLVAALRLLLLMVLTKLLIGFPEMLMGKSLIFTGLP